MCIYCIKDEKIFTQQYINCINITENESMSFDEDLLTLTK